MSVTEQSIREQAREYLHKVAAHDDTNYGNVYVIEGQRIDGATALDMAELALRTQQPIAVQPVVTVAQALELARRLAAVEDTLAGFADGADAKPARKRTAAKGGSDEDQTS